MFGAHCQMLSTKGNTLERFPRSNSSFLPSVAFLIVPFLGKLLERFLESLESFAILSVYENSHHSAKRYLSVYLVGRIILLNLLCLFFQRNKVHFVFCIRGIYILAIFMLLKLWMFLITVIIVLSRSTILRAKRIIHCNITHLLPLPLKTFNNIKIYYHYLAGINRSRKKIISVSTGLWIKLTHTYNFYFCVIRSIYYSKSRI